MFNRKYFILVFFVFLIAITSVSAQDDAVASQDLNELSFNDMWCWILTLMQNTMQMVE